MNTKKKIIGICGSACDNSANLSILKWISESAKSDFDMQIVDDLTGLPHFKTELTKMYLNKLLTFGIKLKMQTES